jgi:hypothetical protein
MACYKLLYSYEAYPYVFDQVTVHEFVNKSVRCLLAFLKGEQLNYFQAMPVPLLLPRAFDGDFCYELSYTISYGFFCIRIVLPILREQGHT